MRGELTLSPAEFEVHCEGAEVLGRKHGLPAVLVHGDGAGLRLVTKVWYPRRRWSSELIWPYRDRFRRALARLRDKGFRVPEELAHGVVEGTRNRFVVYRWLEGTPLCDLGDDLELKSLAEFVVRLHDSGVYFRGLNLGHIVAAGDDDLGLIGVSDIKFFERPLSMRMRERNLGILCSHPPDLAFMLDGNWQELVMAYCRAANMSLTQAARMRDRVRIQMQRRQARWAQHQARKTARRMARRKVRRVARGTRMPDAGGYYVPVPGRHPNPITDNKRRNP